MTLVRKNTQILFWADYNRAALQAGGDSPGPGDCALASLLLLHGLVMNGGVPHALQSVGPSELLAAAEGYAFFGFNHCTVFLRGVAVTHNCLRGRTIQKLRPTADISS